MAVSIQRTGDAATDRALQDVALILTALSDSPLSAPVVLKDVVLGTADVTLAHGLGQPPRGWIVVRKNALTDVAELTTAGDPSQFIVLRAGGPVTCTLVVF